MISLSELPGDEVEPRTVLPLEFEELTESLDEPKEGRDVEFVPAARDNERMLAELEDRLKSQAEETERRIEAERERAVAETRERMTQEMEERLAAEREAVVRLCEQFQRERTRYFAAVEAEVVQLALAIAARVLRRESMLDPLLLRGSVRVALEKVQEGSTATLKVPMEQAEEWQKTLAGERTEVAVVGDARLRASECVLETSVGRIDLGVKAQMEEIEKGFFDLLEKRPA